MLVDHGFNSSTVVSFLVFFCSTNGHEIVPISSIKKGTVVSGINANMKYCRIICPYNKLTKQAANTENVYSLLLPPSSFIRHGGTYHGLPNDTLTNYLLCIISLMIINL